ncbi:cellulase family glycosylhydrolase [Actinoplanes rectilineatus]|uniref:cellulase family glycosylhydrolase n=1 Tax=Actinoplanes rectilineatus TaxID=113571 RepID=UPI0005F2A867|nr:cellulase family glycosylhydrolase [Actinoplanes rectilineatus]
MKNARHFAAVLASALAAGIGLMPSAAYAAPTPKPTPSKTTKPATKPAVTKPAVTKPAATKPVVTKTVGPTLTGRLNASLVAKTINYYPSDAGWSAMWTRFDAVRIEADLTKAATLGADNVRVIIFPQAFGYPAPKAEYTERLRKFVSIAGAAGLTVKFTLFDWWSGYADATGSAAWAKAVIAPYATDPRVLSVELKNEFAPNDTAGVSWVKKLIPSVRAAAPTMPLSMSTDGQTGAAGLGKIKSLLAAAPLDFYDFHFYGSSERSLAEIRRAQAAVSPSPIVIGETGLSTETSSEGDQAVYLARVFRAAQVAGVRSVAPWTLYDFNDGAIPGNSAVSKMPAQYRFGLYRPDDTAKPAAAVVQNAWAGRTIDNSILDLGFEAAPGNSPWRPYLADEGAAIRVKGAARTGTSSVRFTRTERTATTIPSVRVSPITPVQAGQSWHAEAWARGQNVTGSNEMALSWFDINDKWLGQNSSKQVAKGTSGWTRLTVDAVAPAGATSVQLHLKSGDNDGSVWYDDVAIS